jgi:hypothetical protein
MVITDTAVIDVVHDLMDQVQRGNQMIARLCEKAGIDPAEAGRLPGESSLKPAKEHGHKLAPRWPDDGHACEDHPANDADRIKSVGGQEMASSRRDPDTGKYHWKARRSGDGKFVTGECGTRGEAMAEMLLVVDPAGASSVATALNAEWEERRRSSP